MRAHRSRNSMVNGMTRPTEKDNLWRDVPQEIAAQMRPGVDRLVEEIIGAIKLGVPEYSRPLDDAYMAVIRRGVSQGVGQFVERVADPTVSRGEMVELFRRIGQMEAAEGRTLEPLQAALRIGARVAWNRLHETATRTGMDLAGFARVGEAIFLHLDEIVAACAEGFAQAKAEVVGELERRRRRLLDLLIATPPVSHDVIVELARAAGWRLPAKVAAVVLEDKGGQAFPPLPSLPPDVLADMSRRQPCLLVPDPDGPGRAQVIRNGLRSWRAAVGPAVPLDRAASSLRWASHALALAQRGVLHWDGGVVWCAAYMTQLLVFSDEELLLRFATGLLKPLDELNSAQQERLAETMLAWLENWGNATAAAQSLQVHPQTVRYRLRQINELFADELKDPDKRFALEIALRVRSSLSG
jgi:hypothetical protein